MRCKYCQNPCYKKGKRNNSQRYQCKICRKYQQDIYTRPRIPEAIYKGIAGWVCENAGISSLARQFCITKSSVQRIIRTIAGKYNIAVEEKGESYEVDELCTYAGNKKNRIWIIYAYNPQSWKIAAMQVGSRNKKNLKYVLDKVKELTPAKIFTDRLNIYKSLIDRKIHRVYIRCINHIERFKLNLRIWLKCLNRQTISYSKSIEMLYCKMVLITIRQNNEKLV